MSPKERKHLRKAAKLLRTIHNHQHFINTDGSYCQGVGEAYLEDHFNNWHRITIMVEEWMKEEV
jgi:hypothetical protein